MSRFHNISDGFRPIPMTSSGLMSYDRQVPFVTESAEVTVFAQPS